MLWALNNSSHHGCRDPRKHHRCSSCHSFALLLSATLLEDDSPIQVSNSASFNVFSELHKLHSIKNILLSPKELPLFTGRQSLFSPTCLYLKHPSAQQPVWPPCKPQVSLCSCLCAVFFLLLFTWLLAPSYFQTAEVPPL